MTIRQLAQLVCEAVGFDGALTFDASRPDGTPRKLADVAKLNALGWRARIPLREGVRRVYAEAVAGFGVAA